MLTIISVGCCKSHDVVFTVLLLPVASRISTSIHDGVSAKWPLAMFVKYITHADFLK